MTLIAITSPGDGAGATITAFAMALTWPDRVLLAECSPAGGKIMRGYFRYQAPPAGGLWELALAAVRGQAATVDALWAQTIALDAARHRLLLPGLGDPFSSSELSASTWETVAAAFADLPVAVLADAGPIGPEQPFALLRAAELVLVVMRPTLAQVAAAKPRLARLRKALGTDAPLGLCVIGDHPYTPRDIHTALGEFALTLSLPLDERAAAILSEGGGSDWARRRIQVSPLMRAAGAASQAAINFAAGQRRRHAPPRRPTREDHR